MELPKFLLADTSASEVDLYVVHTEYPRFILNVANDDVHWMEEFDPEDEETLKIEAESLIQEAFDFYDREMEALD